MISRRSFLAGIGAGLAALTLPGCAGGSTAGNSAASGNVASNANATGGEGNAANANNAASVAAGTSGAASAALVLCFSATGNTWGVAQKVAAVAGATLERLEPAVAYTSEDLNYNDSSTRASAEQNEGTPRPEIAGGVPDMSAYGTIYLGYPIWWGKAPRIILTLLDDVDLAGKTVVPFCTSGSSGIDGSLSELKTAAAGVTWGNAKRFEASAGDAEIAAWLG